MLKFPHAELVRLVDSVKRAVVGTLCSTVAGRELRYALFRPGPETSDLGGGGCYDQEGKVYIPEDLAALDERFGELIALHESLEVQYKRAGRPHAYADRRALVEELLAAKRIFAEAADCRRYVAWRIGLYPEWKVPAPREIVAQLLLALLADRPRRGTLFQVIKERRL